MPVDPAGTKPGLTKTVEEPEEVHMRCRNQDCDSILATEIKIPGSKGRMYRCVACGQTRNLLVGGGVDL